MGKINFKVNREDYSVGDNDVSSDMTLLDYLRMRLELRGTKYMCREGACGACLVSAVTSPGATPKAVNSCLTSITQCHEWEITTIEKVGNRLDGYHPLQTTLADNHGTQCGHCTPGWIMAMYSLAQGKKELTQLDIEKSFGSNICRCTGYRPIMDAFKKFAKDAPNSQITDIEDLYVCKKTNKTCNRSCGDDEDWCLVSNLSLNSEELIEIELEDGKMWYRVKNIQQIFDILTKDGVDDYMLVCGNTAKGAYPINEYPNHLIDISEVAELKGYEIDQNLVIGANTTLTQLLEVIGVVSKEQNFEYLQNIYEHIEQVGHIPVRNVGSIAGNLMTKYKHDMFSSDIFLLLETVGAYLTILDLQGGQQKLSMQDFLKADMKKKIIYNILLPPLNNEYKLVTFKIMPRAQNAHAIVNAGFLYKLQSDNTVLEARIVFGGLSPSFLRASNSENHLKGKRLFQNDTLQSALKVLNGEIVVIENLPAPSSAFRKQLALALFYKGLLTLCPKDQLGARYQSGPKRLHLSRPVSKAKQEFSTDPELYPLNQPIQKVEGLIQCAGEAPFTDDVPALARELFSALVLATVARGNIQSIDASEALKVPGVVAFYSAKDIPGTNSFMLLGVIVFVKEEEVFCSDEVKYYNQPLGLVVAKSTEIAERAAKLVKVNYNNVKQPVLDIKETKSDEDKTKLLLRIPSVGRGLFVNKTFKSSYTVRGQFHFCMENIACVAKPTEYGLEVHSTSQWMDAVQNTVAKALNIDINRVDVYTRRLGGGFGLKLTRNTLASVACSLAAFKLNRPVRLIQPFSSISRALGTRFPCTCDVEVKVNSRGYIQDMDYRLYEDNGHIVSEIVSILGVDGHSNCYHRLWWDYYCYDGTTDKARNTYCRAPGSLENISMTETIMEQISYELSLDPFDVRMTNLNSLLHGAIQKMGEELKKKAEYDKRKAEVEKFNEENRWVKRGLRWAFMKFAPLCPAGFEVNMSINHGDGSVTINHGGIELGQGINTKAIQICAHFFEIPVDKVKVKPQNTITAPNSIFTSSSITSQSIGMGVEKCCEELLSRLRPIRLLLLRPTWEQLIKRAHGLKVPLQARHYVNDILSPIFQVYGVTLSEVEVDILTGECQVLRVDLYEDVGRSVSPQIDVGQVEGAFIMGMSYWMMENIVYDKNTGEVKSDRPWDYYVAQCRDIPQDFRVSFREDSFSGSVVLGAKVTGEPATCMAISVPFAMRQAIVSARKDAGLPTTQWFTIDGAYTPEQVFMSAATKYEDFKFI